MPERPGRRQRGRPARDEGIFREGGRSALREDESPSPPGARPALDTALRLLARREHSARELHSKLKLRGHQASAIEAVLEELAARGLVSDERFAEAFLRSRLERGQGPLKIRAQLSERGVAPGLIDAALGETEIDWDRRAAAARSRRFGKSPPADRNEMARQARFLRGRGYSEGQVARAVLGESGS